MTPCNVPGIHRHWFAHCRKAWGSVSDLFLPLCFVHVLTAILDGPISPFVSQRWVSLFLLIQKWTQCVFCLGNFLVILYYDYILTLSWEIEFLWPPYNKQGWFTVACLLNHYITVVGYIPVVCHLSTAPGLGSQQLYVSVVHVSTTRFLSDSSCVGSGGIYFMLLIMITQTNTGSKSQTLLLPPPRSFVLM